MDITGLNNLLRPTKLFPIGRNALNYVFVIGLSSLVYEHAYSPYTLLDIKDYQGIYNYIVKGTFIVPISIFLVLWTATSFLSTMVFSLLNQWLSRKFRKKIYNLKMEIADLKKTVKSIDESSETVNGVSLSKSLGADWITYLIAVFREKFTKEDYRSMLVQMDKTKREKEEEFGFIFRALIAIICYFTILSYFGYLLLLILLVLMTFYFLQLIFIYQLMELTPEIITSISRMFPGINGKDSTGNVKESGTSSES